MLAAGEISIAQKLFDKLRELSPEKNLNSYQAESPLGMSICQGRMNCAHSELSSIKPLITAEFRKFPWYIFWKSDNYTITVKNERDTLVGTVSDQQSCGEIESPYIQSLLHFYEICSYPRFDIKVATQKNPISH